MRMLKNLLKGMLVAGLSFSMVSAMDLPLPVAADNETEPAAINTDIIQNPLDPAVGISLAGIKKSDSGNGVSYKVDYDRSSAPYALFTTVIDPYSLLTIVDGKLKSASEIGSPLTADFCFGAGIEILPDSIQVNGYPAAEDSISSDKVEADETTWQVYTLADIPVTGIVNITFMGKIPVPDKSEKPDPERPNPGETDHEESDSPDTEDYTFDSFADPICLLDIEGFPLKSQTDVTNPAAVVEVPLSIKAAAYPFKPNAGWKPTIELDVNDDGGNPVNKGTFTITSEDGSYKKTLPINKDGTLTFSDLSKDVVYTISLDNTLTGYLPGVLVNGVLVKKFPFKVAIQGNKEDLKADYIFTDTDWGYISVIFTKTVDIDVTKEWIGDTFEDRPQFMEFEVYQKDPLQETETKVGEIRLDKTDFEDKTIWVGNFSKQPYYVRGNQKAVYNVAEKNIPGSYMASTTESPVEGHDVFNVKNTFVKGHIVGNITFEGITSKADIPSSVTLHLYADGKEIDSMTVSPTIPGSTLWTYDFGERPETRKDPQTGKDVTIVYAVIQDSIPNFTTGYEPETKDGTSYWNIINTHAPGKTTMSGYILWEGTAAIPNNVEYFVFKDGVSESEFHAKDTMQVSDRFWIYDIPVATGSGNEVPSYSVQERWAAGWSITYDGINIINTPVEKDPTLTIKGEKIWRDGSSSKRPDSVTLELYINNEPSGMKVQAAAAKNWKYELSLDKNKYAENDKSSMTMREVTDLGDKYTTSYSGFNVINTSDVLDVPVTIQWDGGSAASRPAKLTVTLKAVNAAEQIADRTLEVKSGNNSNTWTASFKDLPRFTSNGTAIEYQIVAPTVDGYEAPTVGTAQNNYTITYKSIEEQIKIRITKNWSDENNADKIRPDSLTLNVKNKGAAYGQPVTISKSQVTEKDQNTWMYDLQLPAEVNGEAAVYTLEEVEPFGYSSLIMQPEETEDEETEYAATITNTHKAGMIELAMVKKWEDNSNEDQTRPSSIEISALSSAGEVYKTVKVEAPKRESDTWQFKLSVPQYDGSAAITYAIQEKQVAGYAEPVVTGNQNESFVITNTKAGENKNIPVTIEWVDNNDAAKKRPESVKINLYADDAANPVETATVTGTGNTWSYIFQNLPRQKDGKEIVYKVVEENVPGYKITQPAAGTFKVINTLEGLAGPTETLTGQKTWNDSGNSSARPSSIELFLFNNGQLKKQISVNGTNDWKYEFKDIPTSSTKNVLAEAAIPNYNSAVDGMNVTNTYVSGKKTLSVVMGWEDPTSPGQDATRPSSVTVTLLADGKDSGKSLTLNAANNWSGVFKDLAVKGSDGKDIVYTVRAGSVSGYTTTVKELTYSSGGSEVKSGVFQIINTPGSGSQQNPSSGTTQDIKVTKSWDDNNYSKRPTSITVYLYADGVDTGKSLTLTKSGDWTNTFKGVSVSNSSGNTISYTLKEKEISGYTSTVTKNSNTSFTITNKLAGSGSNGGSNSSGSNSSGTNTSANSNAGLYIGLAIAALVGILALVFVMKRRPSKK